MYFPLELPLGKHIPLYGSIPGRSFRLRHHPETTSQSERGFRDALSAWAAIGKAHPTLRCCGIFFTSAPCTEFDSPRCGRGSVDAAHGRLRFDKHRIHIELIVCAENPRVRFANPHRLRPPAGVLARSLQTLRVCLTLAPCTEFDSPRYGLEIKRQVDISIYLPVTYGGGAENRTPVHESPLIGISKLSRWFCLGRFARSDTLAASQPVRS